MPINTFGAYGHAGLQSAMTFWYEIISKTAGDKGLEHANGSWAVVGSDSTDFLKQAWIGGGVALVGAVYLQMARATGPGGCSRLLTRQDMEGFIAFTIATGLDVFINHGIAEALVHATGDDYAEAALAAVFVTSVVFQYFLHSGLCLSYCGFPNLRSSIYDNPLAITAGAAGRVTSSITSHLVGGRYLQDLTKGPKAVTAAFAGAAATFVVIEGPALAKKVYDNPQHAFDTMVNSVANLCSKISNSACLKIFGTCNRYKSSISTEESALLAAGVPSIINQNQGSNFGNLNDVLADPGAALIQKK